MVSGLKRFLARPLPWLLFYLAGLLPSLLLGPLLMGSFTGLARYPFFRTALETRSLDGVIEMLTQINKALPAPSPWTLFGLCGAGVVLPLLALLRVFLEGGALLVYAEAAAPDLRSFFAGCRRWFGPFLGLDLIGLGLLFIVVAVGAVPVAFVWSAATWLAQVLAVVMALAVGLLATWIELSRAAAVAYDTRNVGVALRRGGALFFRRPLLLLALVLGALGVYALLALLSNAVMRAIPIPWWLASLAAGQVFVLLRLGVRLARQAGEVGLLADSRR